MKTLIQLFLLSSIFIFTYFVYKEYFVKKTENNSKIISYEEKVDQENNQIKNLKYEVSLDDNNRYIITSVLSELVEENGYELVKMQGVEAKFFEKENMLILIKADNANYNNNNFKTDFKKNVSIEYIDNKIFSDKLNLDFKNKMIKIYDNVFYQGNLGTMKSDSIIIDLISEKININVYNENDNIVLKKY